MTDPGKTADMESVDNERRNEFYGFSLERALESERALAEGDTVTLEELTDELRRLHSQDPEPGGRPAHRSSGAAP